MDAFYCSPYKRSMDTIAEAADFFTKEIITDERLREREKGYRECVRVLRDKVRYGFRSCIVSSGNMRDFNDIHHRR